jgi:GNAT superfamily N-acetyltransferase
MKDIVRTTHSTFDIRHSTFAFMVVHLRKLLTGPPVAVEAPGVVVRFMQVPEDVPAWLALRQRAVADLSPSPRPWLHEDYAAEMFDRPWWHAERNWLAIADDQRVAGVTEGLSSLGGGDGPARSAARRSSPAIEASDAASKVVGAVTLAIRESATSGVPVVHWLLVDPAWRRLGIARVLMSQLEHAAWEAGFREVQLETHSGWAAAVAFYQSIGYAPLRDPSPR